MTNDAKNYGEQAGLLLYLDDENYVKLVVEGMRDGSVKICFGIKNAGAASIVSKIPLPGPPNESVTLRLELSQDRKQVTAAVERKVCLQQVGTCAIDFLPAESTDLRVGLTAHGSNGSQQALFRRISIFQILEGRGRFD